MSISPRFVIVFFACVVAATIGGTIVFAATLNSGLIAVPSDGGEPETLTTPDFADQGYAHTWPQFLPGDREVLFSIWPGADFGMAVLSLEDRTQRIVLPGYSGVRYASSGHLLVPWDAGTKKPPETGNCVVYDSDS